MDINTQHTLENYALRMGYTVQYCASLLPDLTDEHGEYELLGTTHYPHDDPSKVITLYEKDSLPHEVGHAVCDQHIADYHTLHEHEREQLADFCADYMLMLTSYARREF